MAASTSTIASVSAMPDGSRPSVSSVNEITTGMPAFWAARVMPIASSTLVIVSAETRSASVSRNDAICSA